MSIFADENTKVIYQGYSPGRRAPVLSGTIGSTAQSSAVSTPAAWSGARGHKSTPASRRHREDRSKCELLFVPGRDRIRRHEGGGGRRSSSSLLRVPAQARALFNRLKRDFPKTRRVPKLPS